MGSFRFPGCYYFVRAVQRGWDLRFLGCYDFVRAVQRGWDLLDFLDVMTLYALPEGVGSFRLPGCYDFVRTVQRGWDLLDLWML